MISISARGIAASIIVGACIVGHARSQPAQPGGGTVTIDRSAGAPDPAGSALALAFLDMCFQAFPARDEPGEKLAPRATVTPLPATEVRKYLHDDPGKGWVYHNPDFGDYIVTIEAPPFHSCGVRRVYATLPSYRFTWQLSTRVWAANRKLGPFTDMPTTTTPSPAGPAVGGGRALLDSAGKPLELFMTIETRLPNGQIEVRLVRRSFQTKA